MATGAPGCEEVTAKSEPAAPPTAPVPGPAAPAGGVVGGVTVVGGGGGIGGAARRPASAVAATPEPGLVSRTTMELLANRIHASSYVNEHLVIDAGSPDFLKYVDGGWKTSWLLDESDQGRPVALTAGLSSLVFLPPIEPTGGAGRGAAVEARLTFSARALVPNQRCSVFFNDRPVGTLDIEIHTRRYAVTIPAALQRSGDNRVRFTFRAAATNAGKRSAAAFTDLTFGPAATAPPPSGAHPVTGGPATLGGVQKPALSLSPSPSRAPAEVGASSRISYFVQVPAAARLVFSYGSAVPGARAEVRVASDRAPVRRLLDAPAPATWTDADLALDLPGGAPEAVRIDLISRGGAVDWGSPRVVVRAAPAASRPTGAEPGDPEGRASPRERTAAPISHIFVWMVDTLRADKVHVDNPGTRVETPNYDAFAADATRFAWAQVPGTWSLPSHASLLTGVYPPVHKAIAHDAKLSRDVRFIAEELKKRGFKTALFSSNGYVSSKWGFDRGWDAYRNFIRENLPNGADYLWKTARPWVLQNAGRREFAYLATV